MKTYFVSLHSGVATWEVKGVKSPHPFIFSNTTRFSTARPHASEMIQCSPTTRCKWIVLCWWSGTSEHKHLNTSSRSAGEGGGRLLRLFRDHIHSLSLIPSSSPLPKWLEAWQKNTVLWKLQAISIIMRHIPEKWMFFMDAFIQPYLTESLP